MKTKVQLLKERETKVNSLESLIEERSESMDDETLEQIEGFKADVENIDLEIRAIDMFQKIAKHNASGAEERTTDETQETMMENFTLFLRGEITDKEYEQRTMTSGTATAGAELVPDEFYRVLEETILEYSDFKMDAFNFTTGDNGTLTMPSIDDTANSGAWITEGGTIPLADAATGERTMAVYKAASGIKVSTELIEDDAFDLVSWVAVNLGVRIARTLNAAFISGDGTGKPLGILVDTTVIEVISNTIGAVDWTDAVELRHALQISSRRGANYYASDDMLKKMELWVDGNNRPLLQPADQATQAKGILFTLGGYPVKLNTELGDVVALDNPLIFGNPKKYMIRNVRGVLIKRNDYLFMGTDEVAFYATTRLDGKLTDVNDTFSKLTVKSV